MRATLLIIAAMLGACAKSEPADPTPADDPRPVNPAVEAAPEDRMTPGSWIARADDGGVAFRSPQGAAILTISCDQRRGLVVQRSGLVPRGQLALMQLSAGGEVRRLAVTASTGDTPQIEAVVPPNDELIAPLIEFDEPLRVRFPGLEPLVLPPSPIVSGKVRECQSVAAPDAAAAGNSQQPRSPSGE